jgi:hypothetical protein
MARHQRTRIKDVNVLLDPTEVRAILSRLCIKLGFCLPPAEIERIAASPPRNIDEFSRAVFVAEGLDPVTSDKQLFNQVREIVAKAFVDYQSKTS